MKSHINPLLQVVQSRVKQLVIRYDESASITHSGTRGSLREGYLKQFLVDLMPASLSISSGFVTDSRGETITPQIDLLVREPYLLPAAMLDDRVAVLPIEVVLMSMEVKSTLDGNTIDQRAKQQEAFRQLRYSWTTFGREHLLTTNCTGIPQFVVVYDTKVTADTAAEWFDKEQQLQSVCVIRKWHLIRDLRSESVSRVEADASHTEVMHLLPLIMDRLEQARDEWTATEREVSPGVTSKCSPDLGAYLTFDVPDHNA